MTPSVMSSRALDGGEVAVVEAHCCPHPGFSNCSRNGPRIGRVESDWLLDPQMLACVSRRDRDLAVQVVRRGDADDVDSRIGDQILPVLELTARLRAVR